MDRRRPWNHRSLAGVCETLKKMRNNDRVTPEMMSMFLEGRGRCPGGRCGSAHALVAEGDSSRFNLKMTKAQQRCGCGSSPKKKSKGRSTPGLIKMLFKLLFKKKRSKKKGKVRQGFVALAAQELKLSILTVENLQVDVITALEKQVAALTVEDQAADLAVKDLKVAAPAVKDLQVDAITAQEKQVAALAVEDQASDLAAKDLKVAALTVKDLQVDIITAQEKQVDTLAVQDQQVFVLADEDQRNVVVEFHRFIPMTLRSSSIYLLSMYGVDKLM